MKRRFTHYEINDIWETPRHLPFIQGSYHGATFVVGISDAKLIPQNWLFIPCE